ncbi:MAG: sensor histidine kinase [Haloferula sp.]
MLGIPVGVWVASCGLWGVELVEDFSELSLAELQKLERGIESELASLAQSSLNSGVGPIGFRSSSSPTHHREEWVQIDLVGDGAVDEVILVPTLWRDTEQGFVSDAFPAAFRIVAGADGDDEGRVVAEFEDTSAWLPRTAPIVVPLEGVDASWIRVEATKLNRRAFDDYYVFQLAELLVMGGQTNRALRRPVTSSRKTSELETWRKECLVDGILPYVMNAAEGRQSLAMVGVVNEGETQVIGIDLGEEFPVSGVRLHAVDQSDTVPQAFGGDFGLPRHFRIEGSMDEEFSDPRILLEQRFDSIFQTGPVMAWDFEEVPCRYVRMLVLEPYQSDSVLKGVMRTGFAEIELTVEGSNVAKGAAVDCNFRVDSPDRSLDALTDGLNLYGEILPVRRWMSELARRHELEAALPLVWAELNSRYDRQKKLLNRVSWVAAILAAGIALMVLYYRVLSLRQENRIRERISANLHDELGANLHAIGLLGDLAKDSVDSREDLVDTVDRIRALTERTGSAAKNCANMILARDVCEDLVAEMERDSSRLLADLDHTLEIDGEDFLRNLNRRRRIDLYLFYKEALVNVIRHSGATRVDIRVKADPKEIRLTVSDNGHGFSGHRPQSLTRRARMLGGQFDVESQESGGTRVVLTLKTRKFGFFS